MKRTLLLLIIIISVYNTAYSQTTSQIAQNVVLLTYADKSNTKGAISSGTGTMIAKLTAPNRVRLFLVTNLHVLPAKFQNQYIEARINLSRNSVDSFTMMPIAIYDKNWNYLLNVQLDKDNEDLVVIEITRLYGDMAINSLKIHLINYDLLATKEYLDTSDVYLGDDIYFIGYPSWFFDNRNISPVVRQGVISTEPKRNFYFNDILRQIYLNKFHQPLPEKLNGFLVDASAVGGSSGSLIFVKTKNITQKEIYVFRPPKILGILKWSFSDLDDRTPYGEKINLGAVVSAERIKALIDVLLTAPPK